MDKPIILSFGEMPQIFLMFLCLQKKNSAAAAAHSNSTDSSSGGVNKAEGSARDKAKLMNGESEFMNRVLHPSFRDYNFFCSEFEATFNISYTIVFDTLIRSFPNFRYRFVHHVWLHWPKARELMSWPVVRRKSVCPCVNLFFKHLL